MIRSALPLLRCVLLAGLAACSTEVDVTAWDVSPAFRHDLYAEHVRVLASDEFEGRAPASQGEEKTVTYLRDRFAELGCEPLAGSWFQEVPLVEITADPDVELVVRGNGEERRYPYGGGVMAWTKRVVASAGVEDSELVFVGHGIVAPEYGWDDYAGVDVRGKTVVVLVNDPGYGSRDPDLFGGFAMTYYGRWTYKYEEAARQGAAGVLVVHETGAAGYPWAVVRGSWSGPQFELRADDGHAGRAAVEGWIPQSTARELLALAGRSLEGLTEAARRRGFRAVPLGLTASLSLSNTIRESTSRNVTAVLRGTERPDEYVLYTAHWDHLGYDRALEAAEGDGIYNGAVDNATGTAGLLELARVFAGGARPARSILFLAVTAEESGLLGSEWFAAHPPVDLADVVAGINMDGLNVHGLARDVEVIGHGSSELEDVLARAAAVQERTVVPDDEPEKGYFYRSDHVSLAKRGVPMLYAKSGADLVAGGVERGRLLADDYRAHRYHKPGDEFDATWDLTGALADLALYHAIGLELARSDAWPNWYPGNEFRATRDASRAGR